MSTPPDGESRLRTMLQPLWARFLPRARITVRIVSAVVIAMTAVLLTAGAFVYWRVSFALDRQLDQDLTAYSQSVAESLQADGRLPASSPGLLSQLYDASGRLLDSNEPSAEPLLSARQVRSATAVGQQVDRGAFLPPPDTTPHRIQFRQVSTSAGTQVAVTAISKRKHDEALRELLVQLAVADLATILAAGLVGWGATRAALGPVERYRRAAARFDGVDGARLPVDQGRDDELVRLGTTFNELLTRIEEGQARERQFLADASHELRSPLAVLTAEVEWARHRPRTEQEVSEVWQSVADQTRHLTTLCDALLSLEEVRETGPSQSTEVSLRPLVEQVVAAHREACDQAGRKLLIVDHLDDDAIRGEANWLELAVRNLIANALRHGQGEITLTLTGDADRVQLAVTDEGGGIPADLGNQAFERFARADAARTTPGHGLGLAIVAAVARRHHGSAELIPGGVRLDIPRGL